MQLFTVLEAYTAATPTQLRDCCERSEVQAGQFAVFRQAKKWFAGYVRSSSVTVRDVLLQS